MPNKSIEESIPSAWLKDHGYEPPAEDVLDIYRGSKEQGQEVHALMTALATEDLSKDFAETLAEFRSKRVPCESYYAEFSDYSEPAQNIVAATAARLERIRSHPLGDLAWTTLDDSSALACAKRIEQAHPETQGVMHGVTVGLKEMFDREGRWSAWGNPSRGPALNAASTAPLVTAIENEGAIVLGTQHMAEFAMSPTGNNVHYGPGRNPHAHDRVSGGSSSGAGMSTGAGHVEVAIGSDTGGSIRIPASYCGVYGLKPTQGLISLSGVMPLAPSLDCPGPLAGKLSNCARSFEAMLKGAVSDTKAPFYKNAGAQSRSSDTFKVLIPTLTAQHPASAQVLAAMNKAVTSLREAGVQCELIEMPEIDSLNTLASIIFAVESAGVHDNLLRSAPNRIGRQVRRRMTKGLLIGASDYHNALKAREVLLRKFMQNTLRDADALLIPATADIAPLISDTIGSDENTLESGCALTSYWTRWINYLGLPAISIPMWLSGQSHPLGIQLCGRPYGERDIMLLAEKLFSGSDAC